MITVRCFFNQIQVSEEPYEIDKEAPSIDLDKDYAEKVCDILLEGGIIESYLIPELSNKTIKFNQ